MFWFILPPELILLFSLWTDTVEAVKWAQPECRQTGSQSEIVKNKWHRGFWLWFSSAADMSYLELPTAPAPACNWTNTDTAAGVAWPQALLRLASLLPQIVGLWWFVFYFLLFRETAAGRGSLPLSGRSEHSHQAISKKSSRMGLNLADKLERI